MKAVEYERMFLAEEKQWWYAGMRAISLSLLGRPEQPRASRFLDAGCGTGNMLVHLAGRGKAVGVDLAEDALRFCRTRGVAVARAGLLELPFRDEVFDCVTSFDVLYHRWVTDELAATREMGRVLRPGGLLLVRVPALELLRGAHDEAVFGRRRYTRKQLRGILEGAGLEVLRTTYANAFLFPLLLLRRGLDRVTGRAGSDVGFLPAILERTFRRLLELEAWLLRRISLPLGTSLFALARRPQGSL